jgi:hypothetical protein
VTVSRSAFAHRPNPRVSRATPLCRAVSLRCVHKVLASPYLVVEMDVFFHETFCSLFLQLYDTGACVYFYFGFIFKGLKNPSQTFSEVEHDARDEILKCGGSLSHHHGMKNK